MYYIQGELTSGFTDQFIRLTKHRCYLLSPHPLWSLRNSERSIYANSMWRGMQGLPFTMGVTILLDLKEYFVLPGEKRNVEIRRARTTSAWRNIYISELFAISKTDMYGNDERQRTHLQLWELEASAIGQVMRGSNSRSVTRQRLKATDGSRKVELTCTPVLLPKTSTYTTTSP